MAAPTPLVRTFWNGRRGQVRWYAAWTDGTQLTDLIVLDVSALAPVPAGSIAKVLSVDCKISGDVNVLLEWSDEAVGVVDYTDATRTVAWVSGDQFKTNWAGQAITIDGVANTIESVASATSLVVVTATGANLNDVAYDVDGFIDRFVGQSDVSFNFKRHYKDNPNSGLKPYSSSSTFVGDILLTTTNAANLDEVMLLITFER